MDNTITKGQFNVSMRQSYVSTRRSSAPELTLGQGRHFGVGGRGVFDPPDFGILTFLYRKYTKLTSQASFAPPEIY